MSQMKPYCFKCGAELDPEAIYCPECGRLQRSMVVRAVEPGAASAPPAPRPDAPHEEPFQFYPDREAPPAQPADAPADQASYYQDPSWQQPDQPDPYATQYTDQGWQAAEQPQPAHGDADPYGHGAWPPEAQHGGDQVYAQQPDAPAAPDPWPGAGYDPNGQHDQAGHEYAAADEEPAPPYGAPDPAAAQAEPWHRPTEAEAPYGQADGAYGQADGSYGQADGPYGQQDAAYGQQDAAYGQREEPYGQAEPPYGQQPEPQAAPEPSWGDDASHDATYARAEPTYGEPEAAAADQPDPWLQRSMPPPVPPAPVPNVPPPPYRPPIASGRPSPPATPPEPTYSSSSPAAPYGSGGYQQPYPASPASRYGQPAAGANPYAPPYQPDAAPPREGPSPVRLIALAAAALLGLFLVGFGIGHLLGVGSGPSAPSAAAPPAATIGPTTQPTQPQTSAPAPTPTPDQGITGNARFARVSSSIPGKCTTSQGCPIQVTLKNNGERGSGTVTVTLTDAPNGNTMATFTGPVPVTDGGATVQVTGFANGDQLPAYLRSGGTVYINSVDVKNGG